MHVKIAGAKLAEETAICPNCGRYTYGGEQAEDVEDRIENVAVEEEIWMVLYRSMNR